MRRRFLTQIVTPYHAPYQTSTSAGAGTLSGVNEITTLPSGGAADIGVPANLQLNE